jgi:hypothetical protein
MRCFDVEKDLTGSEGDGIAGGGFDVTVASRD